MRPAATALADPHAPEPGENVPVALAGETVLCDRSGCLYWPAEAMLIVSDLHLEKGSSYARRGQLLPPYDTVATLAALGAAVRRFNPARIVSLGDSFHDAQGSERLCGGTTASLGAMMAGREWIWISGNHDPDPPASLGGDCASELAIGGLVLRHEPSPARVAGEISGHLHPQARIVRRGKAVRRRCFAFDGTRLIMPAFGAYTGGLNIRDRAFDGLFAEDGLHACLLGRERVYRIDGRQLV